VVNCVWLNSLRLSCVLYVADLCVDGLCVGVGMGEMS